MQWSENGSYDQPWTLVPTGDYYKIVNRRSGKVLGVDSSSTADGAQVIQWTGNGGLDQQWSLVATP
ncbi:MAG: RICIN domain-containing protein [Streptomyces sp.]|nr:RICIN domain-containing protein [Streptomyces sp.]NUS23340.1 RICIN domain-containing protein [Streptomyces sp.]